MRQRRVLIIDDDRRSREELRVRLHAGGHDAEGISSEAGLTPDILELLRPELVLLDAWTGGERRDVARAVVRECREQMGFRLVLMGDGPEGSLRELARRVGADAWTSKDGLISDPERVLGTGPPPPPPRAGDSRLLSMIEEEIALSEPQGPPGVPFYEVEVTLFSEHNFYVAKTPTGQQVGLFVATALPPPVGTAVRAGLSLPRSRRFETRGEVIWVRPRPVLGGRLPPGAGLRLLDLGEGEKAAIRAFLQERAPFSYTGQ